MLINLFLNRIVSAIKSEFNNIDCNGRGGGKNIELSLFACVKMVFKCEIENSRNIFAKLIELQTSYI